MSVVLVDNDVLYKTAMYGLAISILEAAPYGAQQFHALGAARFMIPKKLCKRPPARGTELALAEFEALFARINALEPTDKEIALAAELEFLASRQGQPLDGGESLLCSILLTRCYGYLFTGDKRAITAVGRLLSQENCKPLAGKLVCLEQLFKKLLAHMAPTAIRSAVCAEPNVDRALTTCFACHSAAPEAEGFFEGLNSYVGSIHNAAPGVLHEA